MLTGQDQEHRKYLYQFIRQALTTMSRQAIKVNLSYFLIFSVFFKKVLQAGVFKSFLMLQEMYLNLFVQFCSFF